MKVNVYSIKGEVKEEVELPAIFNEAFRPDLIKRAVISSQTARVQPWGTDPMAGKRTSAESWGSGRGAAMVPRIKNGSKAAFIPQAIGGRRAHPPRAAKNHHEKINKKERRFAIRSALAAVVNKDIVAKRGHKIENIPQIPLVVDDELASIKTAKETREIFKTLGIYDDVIRAKSGKKIRAGKGKLRGRKYKTTKGPLIVVAKDQGIGLGARNHAGVDIVAANNLNTELLAPGTHPGRLTVFTKSAIEMLGGLFQ
ncbi:50S ribosomal protein L4 [Methanobrevibacter filiformis]|uniref:Large ribosomal subunit protein uL4 n=1 Tax=Methanobrevibacter filiformis TaxID=55758 RepID=A0A165ZHD8_9EURY|nr:50S ribosomal protein L4 [Methanobrevibacter filiformis]KZX10722.1 50S ribosomal protein L4 [Methanobrevibacter filiformis]